MSTSVSSSTPLAVSGEWQPSRAAIVGAFAVTYLVWGSTFLGLRIGVETLPPFFLAGCRFTIAGVVLLALSWRGSPAPTKRQWWNALITGALFFFADHSLLTLAAKYIPSGLSSLIAAIIVPLVAVLSSFMLPNHPFTRRSAFGACLGLVGVAVLFIFGDHSGGWSTLLPALGVLFASICWAVAVVLSKRLDLPSNPFLRSGMQMVCGGVMLDVLSQAWGEPLPSAAHPVSLRSLLAFVYLTIFGSILAFSCYMWLLKHVRADLVSTNVFVNPLVAVGLGAWLAHEPLPIAYFIAGPLILGSVYILTMNRPKRAAGTSVKSP